MSQRNGKSVLAKSVLAFLAILAISAFATASAGAADRLDPAFGAGGIAKPQLPPDASQALAGIDDLAGAPGGGSVGALKGLASHGYFGAVRLTAAGDPDPSFGQDGFTAPLSSPWEGFSAEPQAEAVAVQENGKTVVAGYVQEGIRNPTSFGTLLARYRTDGSLDPEFGDEGVVVAPRHAGAGGTVFHGVDVTPAGRIVAVGGRSEHYRSLPKPAGLVYAYKPDGSLDRSFGGDGEVLFSQRERRLAYSSLWGVEVLGDGKILVAGYRNFRIFLARLRPDGRLDRSFGGGDGTVALGIHSRTCCPAAALAVQRDGRIVVAANGGPFHTPRVYLARFRADGKLDRSFGGDGVEAPFLAWRLSVVSAVAVDRGGGIFTVGRGTKTKRNPRGFAYGVVRNRPSGPIDQSFGNHGLRSFHYGGQSYAGAALAQPNGGVLTGGSFATKGKSSNSYRTTLLLARFLR
jgi:uncharacterized delta-60 repeat protein